MASATSLMKAYLTETIPPDGGFIVSAVFIGGSGYTVYEITAYKNVLSETANKLWAGVLPALLVKLN